jgi:hypothetical protein
MHADAMHELRGHELPCDAAQDWSQLGTILAQRPPRCARFARGAKGVAIINGSRSAAAETNLTYPELKN